MKNSKYWLTLSLAAGLAIGGLSGCASEEANQAKLAAAAKIQKADAEKTALARVSNGTVKAAEIEKEKGRLIWSFELNTPGTTDITEVNVDAMTGEVASVEKETASSEAKEKD